MDCNGGCEDASELATTSDEVVVSQHSRIAADALEDCKLWHDG
jgi:hypothetical protein